MSIPMSSGRVRLFGSVRFEDPFGTVLPLASVAQRRLAAVLALSSGRTRRAEALGEILGLTPGGLRAGVCRLRNRLGPDAVATDGAGYRLVTSVDVVQFETLLQHHGDDRLADLDSALDLARGELLDEFRHEAWAQAAVARVDEMRRLAVEERAAVLIERGAPGDAVAALEEHLVVHPLRDPAWCLLVQALAAEGRQADALRAVQTYRHLLAEETGTEPSPAVRAAERRAAAWAAARRRPSRRGHCGVDRRRRHPPRRRVPRRRAS